LSAVQSLWHLLSQAIRIPALHAAPYASFALDEVWLITAS
jgi:hypothetical protein